MLSGERVDFSGSLSASDVKTLVQNRELETLQVSEPVKSETWDLLNEKLFAVRRDVTLRVYGFYSHKCDLTFLRQLPNVQRFCADCLTKATGIEEVATLRNLESLTVGIYGLESFAFLDAVPHRSLRSLALWQTKSKKPRLSSLARFTQLRELYLEGQQTDIEVISHLPQLEKLMLRSITLGGLDMLRGLKHLWSVDIKLGGTKNLAALEGMKRIKYLELWQVRGLSDLSVISTLVGLQFLFLQSLPNVSAFPNLSPLRALRRVCLENMKGLKDMAALLNAPALEELIYVDARGREPAEFAEILKSKTLKKIVVGFGSKKKNDVLADMATRAGIKKFDRSEFSFR